MATLLAVRRLPGRIGVLPGKGSDWALAIWYVGWYLIYAWGGGMAWHFFEQGQRALGDTGDRVSGGLHLYAGLPQLQIGPVALLVARLFSPFGGGVSLILAQLFGAVAGLVILFLARAMAFETRPDLGRAAIERRVRWAGVFFAPVWLYLAVASVHLDDVLAVLLATWAMAAALHRRPAAVGLLVGLAVDAKPWALPFAALLLIVPGARARLGGLAVLALAIGACWSPFLLSDPHTLNAVRFTIVNTPRTALRTLGVSTARTPSWDRPAQSVLGLLAAAAAVRRGRWAAVILVAVAARMLLDPGTNMYYPGSLVAGAVLWDVAGSGWDLPGWTALASLTLFAARYLPVPAQVNGLLLLGYFGLCVLLIVIPCGRAGAGRRRYVRRVAGRFARATELESGRSSSGARS